MKFLAILSVLSVGALAAAVAEPEAYADADAAPVDFLLEKRADCNNRVGLCAGGNFIQKTGCQCRGQVERCDLWACPAGRRQVCGQRRSGCVYV